LQIAKIEFPSPLDEVNPENDNIDVFLHLDDGRVYSFVIATPNNTFQIMDNEGVDYFFGIPPLFVRALTRENVEKAIRAILAEDGGRWLEVYGVRQVSGEQ
jgi:hypothetical protein